MQGSRGGVAHVVNPLFRHRQGGLYAPFLFGTWYSFHNPFFETQITCLMNISYSSSEYTMGAKVPGTFAPYRRAAHGGGDTGCPIGDGHRGSEGGQWTVWTVVFLKAFAYCAYMRYA